MLQFKRPPRPARFAATVRKASKAVETAILAGNKPLFDEALWKKHKAAFIRAQHGKCGYCEQISLNHPGAVEHYAPKSEVQDLVAAGHEVAPTAQVKDRQTPSLCAAGYWWLAYSWDNWLFSCERCNSAWKRCLFPVSSKNRTLPPQRSQKERPLLLNPFGRVDPVAHLRFDPIGQIAPRDGSVRGKATIETCGLDRESLRSARQGLARDTYRHVQRLEKALADADHTKAHHAIEDLLSLGAKHRAHAGMVRSIVNVALNISWRDLSRLKNRL